MSSEIVKLKSIALNLLRELKKAKKAYNSHLDKKPLRMDDAQDASAFNRWANTLEKLAFEEDQHGHAFINASINYFEAVKKPSKKLKPSPWITKSPCL